MVHIEILFQNEEKRLIFRQESDKSLLPVEIDIDVARFGKEGFLMKDGATSRFRGLDLRYPFAACYSIIKKRRKNVFMALQLNHKGFLELSAKTDHAEIRCRSISISDK